MGRVIQNCKSCRQNISINDDSDNVVIHIHLCKAEAFWERDPFRRFGKHDPERTRGYKGPTGPHSTTFQRH